MGELTRSFVHKHSVDVVVTMETFLDDSCVPHSFVLKHSVDVVVTVETFLDDSSVTTCDITLGYFHWVRRSRHGGQEGGIAVYHRNGLQVDTLHISVPDIIDILFFRIILAAMCHIPTTVARE